MTANQLTSPSASLGFTLVEVLMAMLILTVGLLGLLQSIQVAYHHNTRNKLREEAVLVAEEQMNAFKGLKFDAITAPPSACMVARKMVGGTRNFRVFRDWRQIGTPPGKVYAKKLTVAVTWTFQSITTQHMIYTMKTK